MRTLHLHAGHAKTGSSFLQSALALSAGKLAARGICYPDLTQRFAHAAAGRITSGNIHANQKPLMAYVRDADALATKGQSVLFSNEGIFGYFLRGDAADLLREVQDAGFRPRVLCLVRDPLDHAVSLYQQLIKRSGFSKELAEYLAVYAVPSHVLRVLDMLEGLSIEVRLSNYSRHRETLVSVLEDWLRLETDTLEKPATGVVNRSMTAGELVLQRAFNRHLGKRTASLISDPLCNQLPDVRSEYPALRRADLVPFLDRMRELVEPVNARLDPGEAYQIPDPDTALARFRHPDDPQLLTFSQAQLEVLATRLGRHILALEKKAKP